jgi:hypothetical protein
MMCFHTSLGLRSDLSQASAETSRLGPIPLPRPGRRSPRDQESKRPRHPPFVRHQHTTGRADPRHEQQGAGTWKPQCRGLLACFGHGALKRGLCKKESHLYLHLHEMTKPNSALMHFKAEASNTNLIGRLKQGKRSLHTHELLASTSALPLSWTVYLMPSPRSGVG